MKISCLVITCNATLDVGGEGIFARELAIELEKNKGTHSAFLIRNELKGAELIQDSKYYESRLPCIRNSIMLVVNLFLFAIVAIPLALTFVKEQRNKGQITLIHAHDGTFSGIVAVTVGKLSSTPVIITFHGTHILSAYYIFNRLSNIACIIATRLTIFCVENSDYIIGVDLNTVKRIKYATKTDKAMEIIPTFCRRLDDEKCEMRETVIPTLPANSRLIAYIGRLSPEKNVLSLVKAFGEISGTMPNVYLIIVGDGVLREKIEHLVKEIRIQNRVFLLGYVFNISPILKRIECIVLPSKSEGFPQIILEAWSLGVPVVASNRIPYLKNEVNGLTFPPENMEKLKTALIQILTDANLARKIKENARRQLNSFSREDVTEKYVSIFMHARKSS